MVFLDTNVIIYALHSREEEVEVKRKSAVAQRLLSAGPGLGIQVINETIHVLRRRFGLPMKTASIHARFLIAHAQVFDMKRADLEGALELGERHQLSHYDALIAANALNNGAEILYSEDLHHGLLLEGRMRVLNPFLR